MRLILLFLLILVSDLSFSKDNSQAFTIKPMEKGVYLYTSYKNVEGFGRVGSNGLVVIHEDNAYIIDTPWTEEDTKTLVKWVKEQGLKLKGSISTHSHDDRTGGIEWLNANDIPTFASRATNALLTQAGREAATNTFEGPEFWLLKDHIQVFYPGAGHTIDNLVVWLPKSKLLVGGCLVKSLGSKGLGYVAEASIPSWPHTIESLQNVFPDARVVVPGHGKAGDLALLAHTRRLALSALKHTE